MLDMEKLRQTVADPEKARLLAALAVSHERSQRLHEAYRALREICLRTPIGSQGAVEIDRLNRSIEEEVSPVSAETLGDLALTVMPQETQFAASLFNADPLNKADMDAAVLRLFND